MAPADLCLRLKLPPNRKPKRQEAAVGFFLAGALAAINGENFTTQRFNAA